MNNCLNIPIFRNLQLLFEVLEVYTRSPIHMMKKKKLKKFYYQLFKPYSYGEINILIFS